MEIGMIGLGRMGANMVRRLMKGGHKCAVYDRNSAAVDALVAEGAIGAKSEESFIQSMTSPRVIWLMVPAGIVDKAIDGLIPLLSPGDTIVDGGNSFFQDDIARAARLKTSNLHYVDCGVSGGVFGLERGYCLMIGGEKETVTRLEPVFETLAPGESSVPPTEGRTNPSGATAQDGYLHCGPAGRGTFRQDDSQRD